MMKFREFRTNVSESVATNATSVKTFKVGKNKKYEAEVKKVGLKYIAIIDGDELDKFNSAKEAEQAIKDFSELMGR